MIEMRNAVVGMALMFLGSACGGEPASPEALVPDQQQGESGMPHEGQATIAQAAGGSQEVIIPNPDGNWRYGYSVASYTSASYAFTLFNTPSTFGGCSNLPSWRTSDRDPWLSVFQGYGTGACEMPTGVGMHPGPSGELSIVRFTAPSTGYYDIHATFIAGDAGRATVDVAVLAWSRAFCGCLGSASRSLLWQGKLNLEGAGGTASYERGALWLSEGATVDFVVGNGGNGYVSDTTSLAVAITPTLPPPPPAYCPDVQCPQ
jgi:hypothetical protein